MMMEIDRRSGDYSFHQKYTYKCTSVLVQYNIQC